MKIGDRVKSEHLNLEGIIQDMRPCQMETTCGCEDESLTLDPEGSGVRFYYHSRTFDIVERGSADENRNH